MSLKYAILASLYESDRTGYDLARGIDSSIGLFWTATHQQIYRELGSLSDAGFVKFKEVRQDDKPDKKLYTLTRSGLKSLKDWIAEETEQAPHKSALLIKLFAGELVDPSILREEFIRIRAKKKAQLETYLQIEKEHFGQSSNKLSKSAKFQYFTLRFGISDVRAWLKWSEEVLEFLDR